MASITVRLNGGSVQSGGITAAYEDTVRLRSDDLTLGSPRFEIFGYPEGWTAPTGWTEDTGSRVIYAETITPADFDLPASADNLWGKWLFRLLDNGVELDSASGVEIVSPNLGLHALPAGESTQFGGAAQAWAGQLEENLRLLDDVGGGSSSATSLRGNPLATAVGTAADPGTLLMHDGAEWTASDPPATAGQVPQWDGTTLQWVSYAVNTGVAEVDLTGRGASPSLTATECNAGVVVLTGTLAADTVCSLPATPGHTRLFRRDTSGTYTLAIAGADTGVAHLLPGQCRRAAVDATDKLLGEALWVLEMDVIVSLTSPALAAGENLITICKLPSRCAVSQADVQGLVTLSGGNGTYTMSLGTASGGAGPGYDQLIADGAVPAASALRGASVGDAGSAMTAGDAYDSAARTVTLRVETGSQTVAPNQGSVRVHLVARWYGV